MKNILVTGACGLMGEKICSGLLKKGCFILGTDRQTSDYNLAKDNYVFTDLTPQQKDKFPSLLKEYNIDTVIHAACTVDNDFGPIIDEAQSKISRMYDEFVYDESVNAGVKQFILVSTSQVYEMPKTREPIREDDFVKPATNYGRLKYDSEKRLVAALNAKKGDIDMLTAICRVAPIYTFEYVENLRSKIIDPKDGMAFMYRTGEYRFQFCCLHNLVDFIISFIRQADSSSYTGVYNVCDNVLISASEIATFLRNNYNLGPVIQRSVGKDSFKSKINIFKSRDEQKKNYRYLDVDDMLNNNMLDNRKAARFAAFKWNLENTK